jgi:predicted dehydrogenase
MKVALIGYSGFWGEKLARVLSQTGHQIVDWIDTKNEKELENTDADCAIIATPPDTHYNLLMRCMKLGLDVLVEKPMTMKFGQAVVVAKYAVDHGIVLSVDSTFCHTATFKFLKDAGQPLLSYQSIRLAPPMPQAQINAGWDLVVHDLSILKALGLIQAESAMAGAEDGSVATCGVGLPTGGSAFIFASRAWPTKVREIVMHYPRATYLWTLDGLFTHDGEQVVKESVEPLRTLIADFEHRCQNRLIDGVTDGLHGAEVVGCLERLFPHHSSIGTKQSKMGNGLHRNYSGEHLPM